MDKLVNLHFSANELNLILIALGQLPYNQVSELIDHIQRDAGPQLVAAKKQQTTTPIKQVNN